MPKSAHNGLYYALISYARGRDVGIPFHSAWGIDLWVRMCAVFGLGIGNNSLTVPTKLTQVVSSA